MAIVNNPHNIQDIDKQYKTWVKLGKFKAILISSADTWFLRESTYFAREWLSSTSENIPNKADQKKQQMLNAIKNDISFLNALDFTNRDHMRPVFSKTDDKEYYFQFHFFTVDEISKNAYPNNPDKNLLMNNGLFELRILDGNSQNSNIIYSTKVCCNDNSSGQRNNDMNHEILPEKFILTFITPDKNVTMIESDRIYPLDGLYFIYGYGLKGEFVNVYTTKEYDSIIPSPTRIRSLYDDGFVDGGEGAFTSTDLLRCKNTWDETAYPYYFTDATKQRNGLFIDSRYDNGSRRKWFSEKTGSTFPEQTLRDFTLFKDFKLNTEFTNEISGVFYKNANENIESIDCDTLRLDNCKKITGLFANLRKLKTIKNFNFNGVNPDNITDLNDLYFNTALTSIDWSEFPSFRNSKNWIKTFNGSDNDWSPNKTVTEIKLQKDFGKNNKNIEVFEATFKNNGSLTTIENLDLNMPKCTSFKELFRFCNNLKTVNLNNIHSEKAVDCNSMFFMCSSLSNETLDMTGIESFSDMSYMFSSAYRVKTVKFKKGALNFTGKQYKNWEYGPLNSVFNEMQSVENIENLEDLEIPDVISIRELFKTTLKLKSINLPNLNLSTVENASYAFVRTGARSISIPKTEKINNIKTMVCMFNLAESLEQLDFPPLTRENNKQNTTNLKSMDYLFAGCRKLSTPIYIDNLDTSNVTNMLKAFAFDNNTFGYTSSVQYPEIDLRGIENLNTSNVTDMSSLFENSKFKFKEIDLRRWDVSKVRSLNSVFRFTTFKKINITGWDVSKVESMRSLFNGVPIESISDIIGFDTLNFSTNLESLSFYSFFSSCKNLKTAIFPDNFKNINRELAFVEMFESCNNLTNIDMRDSKFTIIGLYDFAAACPKLETVNFGNTKIKLKSAEGAFLNCSSLRQIDGIIELDDSLKIVSGGQYSGTRNTHYRYRDDNEATLENMFQGCDNLRGLKVKNIPGGNLDVFEDITKLKRNQYTVVS